MWLTRRCSRAISPTDPLLCPRRGDRFLLPPQLRAAAAALAAPDRRQAAQRSRGQPHLPGDALLHQEPGADLAAHERSRRARPLRAGVRPRRVHDAVQHVPPLHGGRAPDPHHRRAVRHRARRGRRCAPALLPHRLHHPAPPRALRGGLPARHRQGPQRGPFHRRRPHCPEPWPALRPHRGRDRDHRLADRAAPDHELVRLQPRHRRPDDHPRLRQHCAEPGAPEAAAGAHRRRHPRGGPGI